MYRKIIKKLRRSEIICDFYTVVQSLVSTSRHKFLVGDKIKATVTIEEGKLICDVDENIELDYNASIILLRYFPKYDEKNKLLISDNLYDIKEFLESGGNKLKLAGVDVIYDFNKSELKAVIKKINAHDTSYPLIVILENYDNCIKHIDTKNLKSGKFLDELYKNINAIKDKILNDKIDELSSMEIPLDFTNIFDDDERAAGVHVDNVYDGLLRSLIELGRVDIEYISKITNLDLKEVITSLKGSIYQNPEKWEEKFYKGWESADEYLSGNLMRKLDIANKYNLKYSDYFKDNVKALNSIISVKDKIKEIYVSLGSPWIQRIIIVSFINRVILDEAKLNEGNTTGLKGEFKIKNKTQYSYYCSHKIFEKYGFIKNNYRDMLERGCIYEDISPLEIIENLVNHKQTFVEYLDMKKRKHIDSELTLIVREKEKALNEAFDEFVQTSVFYSSVVETYNKKFAYYSRRNYDGSFLKLPGLNESLTLYPYQKNAIARILLSPNTLLAHEVGSGKTFIMVCAGMELRRMKISEKNLYVVPNNITSQWEDMFIKAYPEANIYCVPAKTFTKTTKQNILHKIKNDDFDAIIMPYSVFDRIEVRRLLKKKDIVEGNIYFEDLGINTLFVDEAHNYKNIPIKSSIKYMLGINPIGSKKCESMMEKVKIVQEDNKGRGVVFATGTPITNSISDLYNMQMYLQSKELTLVGLDSFDNWREMFSEISTRFEVDIDTNSYRMVNRMSEYHNLPELSNIFSQVIDYHKIDKTNSIPDFDGYTDENLEKTKELKDFLNDISNRVDRIRNHTVSRSVDNMLKITMDGRRAALDMRIVDNKLKNYKGGKIDKCIENLIKIYRDTIDKNSTQVVFCDISISNVGKNLAFEKFSVYDEIKNKLIENGIPVGKIAFIHDAENEKQKRELYEKFNNGLIRILIGSTFKLGIGVNIQKKLIAIHHLDVPWRPSDMIQREGRILREGNENEKIYIFRYITKGTFDAYSWQILETKQKFINQVLSSQVDIRNCVEIDDTVLSYAEAKSLALENPLLKERFVVANEIEKLKIEKRSFDTDRENMQVELSEIPQKIKLNDEFIIKLEADIKTRNEYSRANNIDIQIDTSENTNGIANEDKILNDNNIEKNTKQKNVIFDINDPNIKDAEFTECENNANENIENKKDKKDNLDTYEDKTNVNDNEDVDDVKESDSIYENEDSEGGESSEDDEGSEDTDDNIKADSSNEVLSKKEKIAKAHRAELRKKIKEKKKQDEELTKLIFEKVSENVLSKEEVFISNYRGFELYVPTNNVITEANVLIKGSGRYYVKLDKDMKKYIKNIDAVIDSLDERLENTKAYNSKLSNDKKYFMENVRNRFPKEKEIEDLTYKLSLIDMKLKRMQSQ